MRRLFAPGALLLAVGCGGDGPAMQAPDDSAPPAASVPADASKGFSAEQSSGPSSGLDAVD